MWLNQLFNGFDIMVIPAVLATEGVKNVAGLFGVRIKGKLALLLFCIIMLAAGTAMKGLPDNTTYIILSFIRLFSAVGIYSFVSRLFDSLRNKCVTEFKTVKTIKK